MQLRRATAEDSKLLLRWRNDVETRLASHNSDVIGAAAHTHWLATVLKDGRQTLFIALDNEVAVGTLRSVRSERGQTLSWTVAPNARGKGVGKRMLQHWARSNMAADLSESLFAEVKVGNRASANIAESIGMVCAREASGVLYYERPGSTL